MSFFQRRAAMKPLRQQLPVVRSFLCSSSSSSSSCSSSPSTFSSSSSSPRLNSLSSSKWSFSSKLSSSSSFSCSYSNTNERQTIRRRMGSLSLSLTSSTSSKSSTSSTSSVRGLSTAAVKSQLGMFGLDGLNCPKDFARLSQEALHTCNSLLDQLLADNHPGLHTIHLLDQVSDELCRVVDVAELCRNVHPNPEWVEEAEGCFDVLCGFIDRLNTDPLIHSAIERAILSEGAHTWTGEQSRVAHSLKKEMEHRGIHLSNETRAKVMQLDALMRDLSSLFVRTGQDNNSLIQLPLDCKAGILELPTHITKRIRQGPKGYYIPSDSV